MPSRRLLDEGIVTAFASVRGLQDRFVVPSPPGRHTWSVTHAAADREQPNTGMVTADAPGGAAVTPPRTLRRLPLGPRSLSPAGPMRSGLIGLADDAAGLVELVFEDEHPHPAVPAGRHGGPDAGRHQPIAYRLGGLLVVGDRGGAQQ